MLFRKMIPDAFPLLVPQPNHLTFIADRSQSAILRKVLDFSVSWCSTFSDFRGTFFWRLVMRLTRLVRFHRRAKSRDAAVQRKRRPGARSARSAQSARSRAGH